MIPEWCTPGPHGHHTWSIYFSPARNHWIVMTEDNFAEPLPSNWYLFTLGNQ